MSRYIQRREPPADDVRGWLTPEWLQEVLQEYAPEQAKKMGWQTLKQIAEALVMPDFTALSAAHAQREITAQDVIDVLPVEALTVVNVHWVAQLLNRKLAAHPDPMPQGETR